MSRSQNEYVTALHEHVVALGEHVTALHEHVFALGEHDFTLNEHVLSTDEHVTIVSPHNGDDHRAATSDFPFQTHVASPLRVHRIVMWAVQGLATHYDNVRQRLRSVWVI